MKFLHSDIGSAKDNQKSPIHNWYKFTAGFSHQFVDEILSLEKLNRKWTSQIFDPFAGCGTTLVSCQKQGINAVGNEAQKFMYDVIRAKLNWKLEKKEFVENVNRIKRHLKKRSSTYTYKETPHSLLKTLYKRNHLKELYQIKEVISLLSSWKYKLFFNLALSQTLHKTCIHPIAIPYIVRAKRLTPTERTIDIFERISNQMFIDTQAFVNNEKTARIYLQDSRIVSPHIAQNDCNLCITSPPYLNNLDYGEVSKVHSHFFGITDDWNDITEKVRKKLVTGSTTHYRECDFHLDDYKETEFFQQNSHIGRKLLSVTDRIKLTSNERLGKKSFDILTLLYFKDMFAVLCEIRRILKRNAKAYLILGDSAPYGIHIPTTKLLGCISKSAGFDNYRIHKIRTRGTKWKSLTYRHSLELTENVLVLQ